MAELRIESREEGPLGFLAVVGEARLETVDALRLEARGLFTHGVKSLIVDVHRLGFVDSASMGVLLEIQQDCAKGDGTLVLHGVSPRLQKMIDGMGLPNRFPTVTDEAAARKVAAK